MDEEPLLGGVANAGVVTRAGDTVFRPSNPHSVRIHRFLAAVRKAGFDGVPEPIGIAADGREQLRYVAGDVPLPPYPAWAQSDAALASIAALMRGFHDAARGAGTDGTWSVEMADPEGGRVVCHNDVCLENVVFRDGSAVALLDFDFAAPGRPEYDLAQMARMCVPVDDDESAIRFEWLPADRPARVRLVTDAYGLDAPARGAFLEILSGTIEHGGAFVRRKVEAGDPNFTAMWASMGGAERFDRRRRWWAGARETFERALA